MSARILVVDDSPTIRKVVTRILERHDYETLSAGDGVEALQVLEREQADLMLVDFVMPRMNGYQLCLSVRQNERLRDLPVVLMSAKGDKIRGKFVQQTGALDAITKPFDARGLIAVVESALGKADGAPREGSVPPPDPISGPDTSSEGTETRGLESAARLGEFLARALAPALGTAPAQRRAGDGEGWAPRLAHALTPEVIAGLMDEVGALDLAAITGEILSGDLGSISIAEILQLLDQQKKSGALTLHVATKRVTLFMRDGSLDFASYSGLPEAFLIGRYLADHGHLDRAAIEDHVQKSQAQHLALGDYLVEHAIVEPSALTEALKRQTSELLYEVVRWRTGRFRFVERAESELSARARLGLHTAGLVMEGFRRVDEWRLIEDSFDFSDVLFCDALGIANFRDQQGLTAEELRVLGAIDGDATVGEILDGLGGTSFENCKTLYRLLNVRLIKRRTV
jgi:CheY-like chemotaxis protein